MNDIKIYDINLKGSKPNYPRSTRNLYSHTIDGSLLWFSYSTLIALDGIISTNFWSVTTAKHLTWIDPDKSKKEFDKYAKKQEPITKEIKDIEAEMKSLENTLEEAKHDEKELRREAAKTMMGKDIHMEILNIIKEQGISLREGADGVRTYYEIAKLAYMEGLTAGMRNNNI